MPDHGKYHTGSVNIIHFMEVWAIMRRRREASRGAGDPEFV